MNNLKSIRKAARLSLQELADRCGTSKGHMHCIESDKGNPSLKLAYRIAAILGKQVQEIWPDDNEVIEEIITVRRLKLTAAPKQESE
jgi:putative transcriptional regulator